MSQTPKPKTRDLFENLKFIGYCWSNLPPEDVDTTLEDFVRYCKFHLCKASKRLMKDPIWDEYIDEEIIAEYYAHLFTTSKAEREKFESEIVGLDDSIYDWLDKMVSENQKEMSEKAKKLDQGFEFIPDSMGE